MPKVGKLAPRSLRSFGVTGLLGKGCRVYYENFFDTRHVGRVSDLVCTCLRNLGLDELRIRALLLFSLFEANHARKNIAEKIEDKDDPEADLVQNSEKQLQPLLEPMTLECGIDEEKIAIGLAFRGAIPVDPDELSARIAQAKPEGEFETLLLKIYENADGVVLRVQPGVQFEVVSLLGIPRRAKKRKAKEPLEVIVFSDPQAIEQTPAAGDYVVLADVNYSEMLRAKEGSAKAAAPASGEFLSKEFSELENALRVRAQREIVQERIRVAGTGEEDSGERKIQSSGEDSLDTTEVRVGGNPVSNLLTKFWPFKKSDLQKNKDANSLAKDSGAVEALARASIKASVQATLQETIRKCLAAEKSASENTDDEEYVEETLIEGDLTEDKESVTVGGELRSPTRSRKKAVRAKKSRLADESLKLAIEAALDKALDDGLVKSLAQATIREQKKQESEIVRLSGAGDKIDGDRILVKGSREEIPEEIRISKREAASSDSDSFSTSSSEALEAELFPSSESAPAPAAPDSNQSETPNDADTTLDEELLASIRSQVDQGQIDQAMAIIKEQQSKEKDKGKGGAQVQAWMETVVKQLSAEKVRLNQTAKDLTRSVQQKEAEFRRNENMMKKELRQKDELIRQKTNSITRVKEQLDAAMQNVEKLRSSRQDRSGDSQVKQKYETSQRLLVTAREENIRLASKISELKTQVSMAQMSAKNREGSTQSELNKLRTVAERSVKQYEDTKAANDQLAATNRQLAAKIQQMSTFQQHQQKELDRRSASNAAGDLKDSKKLEIITRQLAGAQKEGDAMKSRIDEFKREELRMKRELMLAQQELKSLKAKAGNGGKVA